MNPAQSHLIRMRLVVGVCFFCAPVLVACGKSSLPVSIHGVNYSVEPFSFVLNDPVDPRNQGSGELVDSYAAGGTTCCYELPKKWRPGLKVSIQSKHWVGKDADSSLHDIDSTHLAEVPPYVGDKPGELWILRAADGSFDIVSSDFQPDHPKWPGRVKGWPIPALDYQRQRWDLHIDYEKRGVSLYESRLEELNTTPEVRANTAWEYALNDDKKSLEGFNGPYDAKFRLSLRTHYEKQLALTSARLRNLERERP